MPSLFRRKSTDPAAPGATVPSAEPAARRRVAGAEPAEERPPGDGLAPAAETAVRPRGYTPSKKELGKQTPKRPTAQRRRVNEPPPANRREAMRRMRERQRAERAERFAAMRAGDDAYLGKRDRGPERALVRDIVDSRRTAGTWFFAGAFIVFVGSAGGMPPVVRLASNLLWLVLALAMVLDSLLITRRVRHLVRQRFPQTEQRLGSLYLYAIMRSLTFRRMRMPQPRVKLGQPV